MLTGRAGSSLISVGWGCTGERIPVFAGSTAGSSRARRRRVYLRVSIARNRFLGLTALADFPWIFLPWISVPCRHVVCSDSSVYWGKERCFHRIFVSSHPPPQEPFAVAIAGN